MSSDSAHYVYALTHQDEILYIGKGSGHRLSHQCRAFGLAGRTLEHHRTPKAAYAAEIRLIAQYWPRLNRTRGGGGEIVAQSYEREISRIGSRAYSARFLLERCRAYLAPENIQALIEAAHLTPEFLPTEAHG